MVNPEDGVQKMGVLSSLLCVASQDMWKQTNKAFEDSRKSWACPHCLNHLLLVT